MIIIKPNSGNPALSQFMIPVVVQVSLVQFDSVEIIFLPRSNYFFQADFSRGKQRRNLNILFGIQLDVKILGKEQVLANVKGIVKHGPILTTKNAKR